MLLTIVDTLYSFEVTNYRNACSSDIFDKLTVAQVFKKFFKSFETPSLSSCSREIANGTYQESN